MKATMAIAAILVPLSFGKVCLADPIYYNFSIYEGGSGETYTGTITLGAASKTGFKVTAITGTQSGAYNATITGLSTFDGADNVFYPSGTHYVDSSGIAWTNSASGKVNLSYFGPYYELDDSHLHVEYEPTNMSFTPAVVVPEPRSLALIACGLVTVGLGQWARRRPPRGGIWRERRN